MSGRPPAAVSVAVVGSSTGEVCGVRDYASTLVCHLASSDFDISLIWAGFSTDTSVEQLSLRKVAYQASRADVIIVNYSVFAMAWRGLPLRVPALAWRLWRSRSAVILVAHEMAYPWRRRGWRGFVHSLTQRCALVPLVLVSQTVVVTTEQRCDWLRTRWWLPRRPIYFIPVFSNLRAPHRSLPRRSSRLVGVFGYGHECSHRELVVHAVSSVARIIDGVELVLVGSPGQESAQGRAWQTTAMAAECPYRFTGVIAASAVEKAISDLSVYVSVDDAGPTSRKGSLAAALSHGIPVVAIDGPECWWDLVSSGAVLLVSPELSAVEKALVAVLTDRDLQCTLALAGRQFYESNMSPGVAACKYAGLITEATRGEPGGR